MSDLPGRIGQQALLHVRHTAGRPSSARAASLTPRQQPRARSTFTDVLTRTATFITNARYILAVYTEALLVSFKERSNFDVRSTCRRAVHQKPTLL
ncbi:hypothetical protein [Sorangium sp. So ce117]|uniref:hypothetical protein n=1 Tax=Sorangium sp. So ce117 TaxID=3133277 RepID=UPI003F6366FA